jgi:tRNA dimethylallyltransferase
MNKVITLLGPTGVGKTGLSFILAEKLETEIISADSMLVYRHMDIGTAKPSKRELDAVPHHLINILNPDEQFSAGLFKEKAVEIIERLHDRQKIPLIVGGTGLYIRSLTRGLFEGPGADETLRRTLKEEEISHGRGYLYKRLRAIDPEAARNIEANDLRRTIRALEVSLTSNKAISECRHSSTVPCGYDFIKIGLSRDRKELYRRIEERVDAMMGAGLLEETERLLEMNPKGTALQALGYKEMALYINGFVGLDEAIRLTKKRTKMFAKRQYTWFKKETDIQWVDISGTADSNDIFTKVMNNVAILRKVLYSKKC